MRLGVEYTWKKVGIHPPIPLLAFLRDPSGVELSLKMQLERPTGGETAKDIVPGLHSRDWCPQCCADGRRLIPGGTERSSRVLREDTLHSSCVGKATASGPL